MPTERQPCLCQPGVQCPIGHGTTVAEFLLRDGNITVEKPIPRYCKIAVHDNLKARADALDRIYSIATRELAEPPADGTELLVEFCTIIEEAQAQEAAGSPTSTDR